jgi:hypothetical protein
VFGTFKTASEKAMKRKYYHGEGQTLDLDFLMWQNKDI